MGIRSHIISGFFWEFVHWKEETEVHKTEFTGEINITDKGEFTGRVKDYWGEASVKGKISQAELEFIKEYERPSPTGARGAKGPIRYRLQTLSFNKLDSPLGDPEFAGVWRGMYVITTGETLPDMEEERYGYASCMIYPRPLQHRGDLQRFGIL